ncbi:MAG: flagellar basal body rod protein FlgB [Candidatus Zixiibacteriota bacterium]
MENKITQFLFNRVGVPKFSKFLNLASFQHKLISGNIANALTPGFKSKNINFSSEFKKLTNNGNRLVGNLTNNSHIPLGNHEAKPPLVKELKIEEDEMNSIDIDKEVPKMVQNEMLFTVGATLLQRKFEGIRKAIQSR